MKILDRVEQRKGEGHNFVVVTRKSYEKQKGDLNFSYGHFHYKKGDQVYTCLFFSKEVVDE